MSIELLSPAKDLAHGIAAINHGADAVYMGAPKFGARVAAPNTISDIESLCSYAHKYKSKVYVALNTLLKNEELGQAQAIIHQVYNAGIDALIIQDMGILEMDLPPIPLFASTQTHNINPERIKFLQDVGFQRIILARECSLTDIKTIKQSTNIELESFIHGAICVSYSGQCYISHAVTGRSGNRGECSQMCRSSYSLRDSVGNYLIKNKHLLSLKDLNLSQSIEDLIDAGITSFKIEGRLKDMSYVKNITAYYRKKIDSVLEKKQLSKSSSGTFNFDFTPEPELSFSRGFTPYFIDGKRKPMASFDTPKSIGKRIGAITKINRNSFEIDNPIPISNNDGLCYFNTKNELCGIKVNQTEERIIYPQTMPIAPIGTIIYRNSDVTFEKTLSLSENPRKINIDFELIETDNGLKLVVTDEDAISCITTIDCEKEIAQNHDKSNNVIITQLSKTGNTIFKVQSINIQFQKPLFIRSIVINELRRTVLDLLEKKRVETWKQPSVIHSKNDIPYPFTTVDFTANILNRNAIDFYKRHGVTQFEDGFELQTNFKGKTVMTTRYCLRNELGICLMNKQHKQPENIKPPLFLENNGRSFLLEFDCKKCEMKVIIPED